MFKNKMIKSCAVTALMLGISQSSYAVDGTIGDIFLFAGNFCPTNTMPANGRLLSIADNNNDALYTLLGPTYGGDGRKTFALPDLRGALPVHLGRGAGLRPITAGPPTGSTQVKLNAQQLPSHSHAAYASSDASHFHAFGDHTHAANLATHTGAGSSPSPSGNSFATYGGGTNAYATGPANGAAMASGSVSIAPFARGKTGQSGGVTAGTVGEGSPVDLQNPYVTLQYCIVVEGVYPSRK